MVRRFLKRVQNTVAKYSLFKPEETLIVGVSGGPDSLCLLDVLVLLKEKYHFSLHVAHVNYHLRGEDSLLDEALVKETAKKYSLPFHILSYHRKETSPSEEKLRTVRYDFFEKLREKYMADAIVIAHNRDDEAETLLLRLIRGSGLSGLSAMRPRNKYIIRPLIETSREDIIEYLTNRSLIFRKDMSNDDAKYLRNKVRHILLPLLEKEFQPQIKKLLAETALLLGEDYDLLQNQGAHIPLVRKDGVIEFSCRNLLQMPPALITQELRFLLRPFLAGKNPSKNLIFECMKAFKSTKKKNQVITCKGLKCIRKGDTVRLLNF
ncbi:MAG: tRNA lysidine(34) synthetase TilS [Candidatus Moranbacteria bacterium CG2_30_41_165]|nr:MAG: tRNA lysidine(34) synthetase TilS [Candidatus Moranbacteria bacterium CG2_30_41_165]